MRGINVLNAIKERRSIHHFKPEEVDTAKLQAIFTSASYAPTHYMKEPWRIKLYQGEGKHVLVNAIIESYQRSGMIKRDGHPKTKRTIASISQFLMSIPHHALIYFEKESDPIRYEELYASVCAFIQNAQLAGWERGVGMLWTITPYMHDPVFINEMGLDDDIYKIAAVMQIGYPEKIPVSKGRTPIEQNMEIISSR